CLLQRAQELSPVTHDSRPLVRKPTPSRLQRKCEVAKVDIRLLPHLRTQRVSHLIQRSSGSGGEHDPEGAIGSSTHRSLRRLLDDAVSVRAAHTERAYPRAQGPCANPWTRRLPDRERAALDAEFDVGDFEAGKRRQFAMPD